MKDYKAVMTGTGFLLLEFKQIAKLILQGEDTNEIKRIVFEENLFQYKKITAITRIYPTVLRRCQCIPNELLELSQTETLNNVKIINLLTIMEDDILFKEFMIEEVGEGYKTSNLLFGQANVNRFFNNKIDQQTKVADFKESTLNKLRQVYLKILSESGLLNSIKNGELQPIFLDNYIKDQLISNGYKYFVNMLEGNLDAINI